MIFGTVLSSGGNCPNSAILNEIKATLKETLKEMPSRTDMEEVIGHLIATTTAAMKLA